MSRPLRILITNIYLKTRTGTEAVVRDLALGLRAAGHVPMVYSPELGDIATEIATAGVPVADDLRRIPQRPDVVHGHHHVETVQALQHFPQACGIFVCHDRLAWHDIPPFFPRVYRYVAVDLNCRERLEESGRIPDSRITVIYNWVRMDRFLRRPSLPPSPRRALIFSNYAGVLTHREPIQEACRALKIPVDIVGSGVGSVVDRPEQLLGAYDLVFAKARCALEAMAAGAAVVLCDAQGLGPMVTAREVASLRQWNFGMRCLGTPLDPERIKREIGRYDALDAGEVCTYVRDDASFDDALDRYVRLYDDVLTEHHGRPSPAPDESGEYLRATVQRLGALEQDLQHARSSQWMPEISRAASARLRLHIRRAPAEVRRGTDFRIQVELENRTACTLGTFPPFPVNFAYRWMSTPSRDVVVREGGRTPLPRALRPGQKATYLIRVTAPDKPGKYRVRTTLVQESLRWLDDRFPRVCSEAPILVE